MRLYLKLDTQCYRIIEEIEGKNKRIRGIKPESKLILKILEIHCLKWGPVLALSFLAAKQNETELITMFSV